MRILLSGLFHRPPCKRRVPSGPPQAARPGYPSLFALGAAGFLLLLCATRPAAGQSPPPFPSQVSATRGTHPGGVRIWWTPVTGANAYDIWRSNVPDRNTAQYLASVGGSKTEYIDTSIPPNTPFYYWVRTVIVAGVPSDFGYSHEGFWVPGPGAPVNVQATDGLFLHRIQVTWDPVSGATGYQVWRSVQDDRQTAEQIATTQATEFWDDQIDMLTTYYYWVKAFNHEGVSGFSWSNPGFAQPAPPDPVSGLTASAGAFLDFIRLAWQPAAGAVGYEIWRSAGPDLWMSERIAQTAGATTYDDEAVSPVVPYTYWVRAVNPLGAGGFSDAATGFRELKLPEKPLSITASDGMYAGRVRVAWQEAERAAFYDILRNVVRDLPSASAIARVPAGPGVHEYWDSSGEGGRVYFYWVRGVNAAGAGEASWSASGYWTPGPSAPTFVQATGGTLANAVRVTWLEAPGAFLYEVWRHVVPDSSGAERIGTVQGTMFLDESVLPGQLYTYWIRASNAEGTSGFSWSASGYAEGPPPSFRSVAVGSAHALEDQVVLLPVILQSRGDENALSFSAQFDPNHLSFRSLVSGGGLPAGTLFIQNIQQAASGRIGAGAALAPGSTLGGGPVVVALLEFSVRAGSADRWIPVLFADVPNAREVVGAEAQPLPAQWIAGGIQVGMPPAPGYEADVSPAPDGDGRVTLQDWVQVGRYVAGLDPEPTGSLFQRADCAPRDTLGDGLLTLGDWVQAGRYAQGLDPLTGAGGPSAPPGMPLSAEEFPIPLGAPVSPVRVHVDSGRWEDRPVAPVLMESPGGVNALSFSVSFDAAAWVYQGLVTGPEIEQAGGLVLLNDLEAAAGRLGVLIAMPPGGELPAGLRKLVEVRLSPVDPGLQGVFPVELTGSPTARSVVDPEARTLAAQFESGTLSVGTTGGNGEEPPSAPARLWPEPDTEWREIVFSWPSRSGRTYRIERSFDLVHWHALDRVTGQPDRTEYRRRIGTESRVFLRVVGE